jgi:EAL domain-containing protein (putative c-di-GMP-specific phosphodiesterase class I)
MTSRGLSQCLWAKYSLGFEVEGSEMKTQLELGGTELVAWYQRYETPSLRFQGELLTRPNSYLATEQYFNQSKIGDLFAILEWHLRLVEELHRDFGVDLSINIHNSMVESASDRDRFLELLSREEHSVTFEFTETRPMPQPDVSNRLLRSIRELGHRSSLDDFGTGYNGISLLTDYDFDVIKIDRSLVAGFETQIEKQQAMRLLARMLDVLGKSHVVEGVETENAHEFLLDAGFSVFQGYLFHQPEPVVNLIRNVREEVV